MWKSLALAVAVLSPVAAPQFFHAAQPTSAAQALPVGAPPAAGKTFAATCRGDQVLDSRPDPAWVGESFAGDRCRAPSMPVVFDGTRATRQEVVAAMASAKRYAAASASFERCVSDYVAARQAKGAHPLTEAELVIENHRVLTSQRARDRAQAQVNAEINAFNEYGSECPDHG